MSSFPTALDQDIDIPRVDDNITEIGQAAINALRDAVFAIEEALGIKINGSKNSLADRFDVSINPDGTIKSSALSAVGLASLPITGNQVATASIGEEKLDLDYATSDLHTSILALQSLISSLNTFTNAIFTDLNLHISGAETLSDNNTLARHVASQIDINSIPFDARDPSFNWSGLKDKTGILRDATHVALALQEINDDLTSHENATTEAHPATAIIVDTDNFVEIPNTATSAQLVFDYLDNAEVLDLGQHRATQHANGIPRISRSETLIVDGYETTFAGHGTVVVPPTSAIAYLVHSPNTMPVDDLSIGDDIIKFSPDNSNFVFDALFSQVKVGDIIYIDYNNGTSASFPIESIRFIPGTEWIVRINGVNLADASNAIARIDRALYDVDTAGILAVAAANAHDASGTTYTTILSSIIVGHPRGAMALGLGFDSNKLNSTHYQLYLELYPSGNPSDRVISLPSIDVTGNAGITPGNYNLDFIISNLNDQFRRFGYNYRFIAFQYKGEVGIMLADPINKASFAIISGDNSSGTLATGTYTNNIIGGNSLDDFDALGFGVLGSNIASPKYQDTWNDATAALIPTHIIAPLKKRFYTVNGTKLDSFAPTYLAIGDGYWDGYISARNPIASSTVEVTYTILQDLKPAGLKPGKTIVIQPTITYDNVNYFDVDYGRFIIKDVNFVSACPGVQAQTQITVINGLHASTNPIGFSSSPPLDVKIYFGYDSVDFDKQNIIDNGVSATNYSRLHEIYINNEGKTFSHERARLLKQSESATLLSTTNWHMVGMSPKLRGYTDGTAGIFNKYLRLYILSYDSVTGEYDGYLGQRVPSTSQIIRTGVISTGRKNVTTRFWDETNVDYIDLIFRDDSVSPGSGIMSTDSPRYVDIELFPSLEKDDELLLLASCEVTWSPDHGADIVQYVKDLRQYGSVDETDFTDSAIDFISAADKYLHENGIFRGFDFDSISSVSNSGEIFFKGGTALVNGKVIAANNQSVVIPQVYPAGTSVPQSLTWAVCVNESGNLIPIIITSTKQQFFATPGSSSYYLPSTTFSELVETRKDLLPIYIANVTIASLTINSVNDIRRFINSQNLTQSLVWSSDRNTFGNFISFDALKNWITNSDGYYNEVKLRGTFNIDSTIDLTGFDKTVIFDGTNAVLNVNTEQGFFIGSNVTLKNCTFNYATSGLTFTSNFLLNRGNACLYATARSDVDNLVIEKCIFNYTMGSDVQRPPFILLEMNAGQVDQDISIQHNRFNDLSTTTLLSQSQAAIAIITLNAGSADPALLLNCNINNNYCNYKQGIYITTVAGTTLAADSPGLNTVNCVISNNTCGPIGYVISGIESTLEEVTNIDQLINLTIEKNSCSVIGNFYNGCNKQLDVAESQYAFGKVKVIRNNTHWMFLQTLDSTSSNQYSLLQIIQNNFDAFDSTYLTLFSPTLHNYALYIANSSVENSECLIDGNIFNYGRYDGTTYGWDRLISCDSSATITNNILKGINTSGKIINLTNDGGGGATKNYIVQGNKLYRDTKNITNFVTLVSSGTTTAGIMTENFFDSSTIDGSSLNVISNIPSGWRIEKNKNQTLVYTIPLAAVTNAATSNILHGPTGKTSTVVAPSFDVHKLTVVYLSADGDVSFNLYIPFSAILPNGTNLVSLALASIASSIPATSATVQITAEYYDGTTESTSATAWSTSTSTLTLTSAASSPFFRYGFGSTASNFGSIRIIVHANGAADANFEMSSLTVTARY